MENSAAFYQTFFQHETLFRVTEPLEIEEAKSTEEQAAEEVVLAEKKPTEPAPATPPAPEKVPVVSAPVAIASPKPDESFPALQHKILVLIDEKSQEKLQPADAALLENILKATGHDIAETDILNFSTIAQADARAVLAQKSTHFFISFGVPLIKLKLDLLLPPYTPKKIEGIWFLLAEPLSVIDADKARKKRLWLALKQMFAVG